MSYFAEQDSTRKRKTKKLLHSAMFSLLERGSFEKITVRDICEEARISRATFYSYHIDKYDFLEEWLLDIIPKAMSDGAPYKPTEEAVNRFISENKTVIRNMFQDADSETYAIFFKTMLTTIDLREEPNSQDDLKYIVMSNFFAGGMISCLQWQVQNKFPAKIPPMNMYLFDIVSHFREWTHE